MGRLLGQEMFCTGNMETVVSISSLQPIWADMNDFSDSVGSNVSMGGASMKSNYSRSPDEEEKAPSQGRDQQQQKGCCCPPAGQRSLDLQQIKWS